MSIFVAYSFDLHDIYHLHPKLKVDLYGFVFPLGGLLHTFAATPVRNNMMLAGCYLSWDVSTLDGVSFPIIILLALMAIAFIVCLFHHWVCGSWVHHPF